VRRWFQKFCNGDESLQDAEGRGRPSVINDDVLKTLVEANPRVTVRELAKDLGVSKSVVSDGLKRIGKSKKLDKWVPHNLNKNKKNRRFEVSSALLLCNKNYLFLDRIVTCDEKRILYDNRRRSAQWLDHDEAPQHFPKPNLHQRKIMMTVWWSAAGVIHHSFLNPGETITAEKYCHQIDEMHQKLRQQHPALVNRKRPILLHDNARPHVARPTLQKLNELGYETLPHPPYSPDLSPTDYYFFSTKHLDHFLTKKCFKNQNDVKNAFNDFIASRTPDFYSSGINKLVSRWKSVLILMVLISINKVLFKLSYEYLKLTVKNRHYFQDNLEESTELKLEELKQESERNRENKKIEIFEDENQDKIKN
jgi:histone-lysine N-methyltransferase SETMAR